MKTPEIAAAWAELEAELEAAWDAWDAALREELAEARKDARRYQHVRKNPAMLLHLSNKGFDEAIDAAIAQEGK